MAINDIPIQVDRRNRFTSKVPVGKFVGVGATTLVAAIAALTAVVVVQASDDADRQPSPAVQTTASTRDELMRDLVNSGLIPRQSLETAATTRDQLMRDLVNSGLIPRQSLETAATTRDQLMRDLVNSGLIPRQSLDEG